MPVEEHTISWATLSDQPVRMWAITDHTGWKQIEPSGVTYAPHCWQGTIEMEPGYVRAEELIGDVHAEYGQPSNIQRVPEASSIGLVLGLLLLIGFGRKRSAG